MATVESMCSARRLNREYLLPVLFMSWLVSLCPIAHAQCALHVGNEAKASNVRVILSRAAGLTDKVADSQHKATTFEEIAHMLWSMGDKSEASQFYECAMKAGADVFIPDSTVHDTLFQIGLIADRARNGDISGALAHVKDFSGADQDWLRMHLVFALVVQDEFEIAQQLASTISQTKD